MEKLHEFFNIPSYYSDLAIEIHSENLMPLLIVNPIDYMRHLYSTDSKLFYNVRDELVLRGIGFQPKYQSNYLLDRTYEIKHILYKNDDTYAFEKIDFGMLGANNFIERFNVTSDLFFKNTPLEGILHFTQGVSFLLLQKVFKEAGFLIVPVIEYTASPILSVGEPYKTKEKEHEPMESHDEKKPYEIALPEDISNLNLPVKYFYEDAIFLTFHKYCHVNGIHNFSELTVDFIEKYQYEKYVRSMTAIKAMELYLEIHHRYNASDYDLRNVVTLLQKNSFKSILEYINIDYLAFIDDFYSSDEVGIHQAIFPFEKAQIISQKMLDSSEEIQAEKQLQEFNQLIREIGDHPKFKYVLSYKLAEIQDVFNRIWDKSLNLELYLFDVLEDINYIGVLSDILVELNHMDDIHVVLEKIAIAFSSRDLEVLQLRQTKTLQEVGDVLNVTRERVRQIERKSRNRLVLYKNQINLKLYFQYCTEHSKLLTLDDFMKSFEIEGNLNKTLLYIFFGLDESITYISELDRYILTMDYEEIRESIEKIDYSQPIIEITELKQLFNDDVFNIAREVVDLLIHSHNFKRVNNIYIRESISIIARINYLFKYVIKEPLEMDNAGYELFKEHMENTFNIPFISNKRAASARIAAGENVILVNANTFAPHNGDSITEIFLAKMEQVLDERLTVLNYVDPRWLFKEYEPLMKQIGLHSPEHLYSIIQLYLSDKYETGHRNSLYIFKSNANRLDAETILLNYLRANGHEAKREVILEDLSWKNLKLDQLVPRLNTVILISNNTVKTIESFNFTDEELSELRNVIELELVKGYVFTYDLQFELAFNEKLDLLIKRCNLTDDVTLGAIIKWLYPSINGYSKLLYWSNSSITKIEQAIAAEFPEFIARNEMIEFVEGKGYGEQTIYRMPSDILNNGLFYSYTNTKYINANLLTFNEEVKLSLKGYLQKQFVSKEYCSLFELVGYSHALAPISSYEWTEHLIGQFAELIGYRKIQTHINFRFDKPVLVKIDIPIQRFDQLVLHIVKTEYTGRYHEEDLAKYLVSKKIGHNPRRLTHEIYNSPLFKFDSFGFFEIRGENDGTN